ncbi:hypothetical protein Tco_0075748, partial [Tanacetum coccineum]
MLQLAIRGTLANGEWISEPHRVKNEFFTNFKKQFSPIQAPSICFDFTFPTRLSSDQVQDLERPVTYEEVKRAVWDCGTNKSPGPDEISFEFYRKYWTTIDDDVFQAVYLYLLVPTGRYVVPTGRVIATVSIKVPAGRYIVPAGYIVPTGRT